MFQILFENQDMVVIDKPAGYHVHPPEVRPEKVPREKVVLYNLRDQIGKKLFPVHRLDAGTSGVLLFALSSEAASILAKQFMERTTEKKYRAVVRGYAPEQGRIDSPLENEKDGTLLDAQTDFVTLQKTELPFAVGKRFSTSRYSLIEAWPKTGRFHQIRRHLNRISHPIIGDAQHGDSKHNGFFRNTLGISGLCLRAVELKIQFDGNLMHFQAPKDSKPGKKWEHVEQKVFG